MKEELFPKGQKHGPGKQMGLPGYDCGAVRPASTTRCVRELGHAGEHRSESGLTWVCQHPRKQSSFTAVFLEVGMPMRRVWLCRDCGATGVHR